MVNFPAVEWIHQSLSVDPSGFRDLKQSIHGYLGNVDTSAGGVLDFGSINTAGSGAISDTQLVYARLSSMGDASGIYNMRFFIVSASAFTAGVYRFLERKSLHFIPSLTLDSSADNTSTNVPINANFSGTIQTPIWQTGQPWMSGLLDGDVSQYAYLAVEANVSVPVGTKGGAGAGSFRYRLLYDFS
jgi:hypothetical protein